MFDLQSDKSLGHHSAHWQVNGRILLLSRDRGRISQRALTTHSAEGSTIMAPAPVRGRGGLPSDRHSQEQICQAPLKYKKVFKKVLFLWQLYYYLPVFSLRWGPKSVCRAAQTSLYTPDSIHYAILSLLYCKSCSGILLPVVSFHCFAHHYLQEYERAVIFRLGRLVTGGARGPGVFFVIPCLDVYEKIDMRTATYDVPPQEVNL